MHVRVRVSVIVCVLYEYMYRLLMTAFHRDCCVQISVLVLTSVSTIFAPQHSLYCFSHATN